MAFGHRIGADLRRLRDDVLPRYLYALAGRIEERRARQRQRLGVLITAQLKNHRAIPKRRERLAIDPNKNNILYFGARSGNGLWRSTDYGATWSKVTGFPNPGTYVENPDYEYQSDIVGLAWITFDPSTGSPGQATQTIYVGVADKNESVYRSTDGGATWTAVPGQPVGYLPHHGVLASNGQLYIPYSDGVGPYDGTKGDLWKYDTATGAWTNISPIPSSSSDNYFGYGGIAVDAQHPNTLVVATLNSWWPDALLFRDT